VNEAVLNSFFIHLWLLLPLREEKTSIFMACGSYKWLISRSRSEWKIKTESILSISPWHIKKFSLFPLLRSLHFPWATNKVKLASVKNLCPKDLVQSGQRRLLEGCFCRPNPFSFSRKIGKVISPIRQKCLFIRNQSSTYEEMSSVDNSKQNSCESINNPANFNLPKQIFSFS
jgi:hypothetical protein